MGACTTPGLGVLLFALMSGCAITPTPPDAYRFAVMGDTPYSAIEERRMATGLDVSHMPDGDRIMRNSEENVPVKRH